MSECDGCCSAVCGKPGSFFLWASSLLCFSMKGTSWSVPKRLYILISCTVQKNKRMRFQIRCCWKKNFTWPQHVFRSQDPYLCWHTNLLRNNAFIFFKRVTSYPLAVRSVLCTFSDPNVIDLQPWNEMYLCALHLLCICSPSALHISAQPRPWPGVWTWFMSLSHSTSSFKSHCVDESRECFNIWRYKRFCFNHVTFLRISDYC